MSDFSATGVIYTEHSALRASTPIMSLWSFQSAARERNRPTVAQRPDGSQEFWLERCDPLLNTILPGMAVSIVVNFGDLWAAGRSLPASSLIPRVSVIGPCTQSRILRVERSVRAIGAVLPTSLACDLFGVAASALVDRIVPLDDLWGDDRPERLLDSLALLDGRQSVSVLMDVLRSRIGELSSREPVAAMAARAITVRNGNVSIARMARAHGLSRHQFARRFTESAGVPPKLFARIARFQALVQSLLVTDVAQWASLSSGLGFYDQAHMINEFHTLAGAPPTTFFQPHDTSIDPARIHLRGRPNDWMERTRAR